MITLLRYAVLSLMIQMPVLAVRAGEQEARTPWESPWLIEEVTRVDALPLDDSDRARICLIAQDLWFLKGDFHWGKGADGVYDFSELPRVTVRYQYFAKYGDPLPLRAGPAKPPPVRLPDNSPKKYLLVSLRLQQPVAFPRNLPLVGDESAGFCVVDANGSRLGRFIGLYQMGANWKILIFEGVWPEVVGLSVRDETGHLESLVSELAPFPYRALGLSVYQVRRIESVMVRYFTDLYQLRWKYTVATAARQDEQEGETLRLRSATERAISKVLTKKQTETLNRLKERTNWTSTIPVELPPKKPVTSRQPS